MIETRTARTDFGSSVWWGTEADVRKLIELVEELQTSASEPVRQRLIEVQRAADKENDERLLRMADAIATGISKRGGDPGSFAEPKFLLDEVEGHRRMAFDQDALENETSQIPNVARHFGYETLSRAIFGLVCHFPKSSALLQCINDGPL